MSLEKLEKLAIETFARVRGDNSVLGRHGSTGVDLQIVPGQSRLGDLTPIFTVRLFVWDGDSIRDIKEQEVTLIPMGGDEERTPAYLEGLAIGVRQRAERGDELETLMPHELIPHHAFRDPSRRTAADFAACVTSQRPSSAEPRDFSDVSGTTPIAENAELERAIAEEPDNLDSHLVYADWLTEHGDPRGELIVCSAPSASVAARQRAGQILVQNERYFAGNFLMLDDSRYDEHLGIAWALGWIESAWMRTSWDFAEKHPKFVERTLAALLALPSSKFLKALKIGCFDLQGDNDYGKLHPLLLQGGPRRTLRWLFFGDLEAEEQEISWVNAGDLGALRGLYPDLRHLKIRAGHMNLEDGLAYPKLESLIIESGGMSQENIRTIAAASFPELSNLEVWFGSRHYGATSTIDDLGPLLEGKLLPKLEKLGLRNCEYTDEICRALPSSGLLEHVREVDLSMGVMTDAGAEALLARRDAFARVTKLDVSSNYLSNGAVSALMEGLGAQMTIEAAGQRTVDEDERYVIVGE
jgi:uncharacterized protein (TIGR02996 family)